MSRTTKREALEVLICERIEQRAAQLEKFPPTDDPTKRILNGRRLSYQDAIRIVRNTFEEVR